MGGQSKYTKYVEWIVIITLFLGVFFISKELGLTKDLKSDTILGKVTSIVGAIPVAFLVLAVHELGHLTVGLINGFRFELFVVGPLGIMREDDKVKAYLNKNIAYYGGVAATSPTRDSQDNAKKFARVLLAGPLASIVFFVFCLAFVPFTAPPLSTLFFMSGMISAVIFIVTTIPSRTGMFFTDRKRYQRLTTPGKEQDVELAILKVMGQYSKDNSYQSVNEEDIKVLLTDDT
ncbi:MAG: M50 family metallopeptidase, partial [Bacteroidota bacterium]